jgi:uncharacterized protein YyaL (SSP411 family)
MARPSARPAWIAAVVVLAASVGATPARGDATGGIAWEEWGPAAFQRAKAQGRPVVVDVSAAWCHWCHVMDETTWADPRVAAKVAAGFVAVRADADARPDLAERFAAYHWPATVFLSPDATPILALRGYRAADEMVATLDRVAQAARTGAVIEAPTTSSGTAAAGQGDEGFLRSFAARLSEVLEREHDAEQGGWGRGQKYPHAAAALHALLLAGFLRASPVHVGEAYAERAKKALLGTERLLDPVWGGAYQYSEGGVWTKPHHEKIASVNAGAMSCFAEAYRRTGDAKWVADARLVHRFTTEFLRTASGAFATSQDADVGPGVDGDAYFAKSDEGRRRIGVPRVDPAIYAQENGWLATALCDLYVATARGGATPEAAALAEARAAVLAIEATHRGDGGLFRHAAGDRGSRHLGDQVAMGRAYLALHQAAGDRADYEKAKTLAAAVIRAFGDPERGGFYGTTVDPTATGAFATRHKPFVGNALAARFFGDLAAIEEHLEEEVAPSERDRRVAIRALGAISDEGLAERIGPRAGEALLAAERLLGPSVFVTVVGKGEAGEARWRESLGLDSPIVYRARAAEADGLPTPKDGGFEVCDSTGTCFPIVETLEALTKTLDPLVRR